jgi:protein gp37
MSGTKYWDVSWNPVTGCTPCSEGCEHCYAKRIYEKFYYDKDFGKITLNPEKLDKPSRMSPKVIFVDSMTDLFHEKVPFEFIVKVFEVMMQTPQHIYLICTKRSGRMLEFFCWLRSNGITSIYACENMWFAVTVESQAHTDRIDDLLKAPVMHRYISYEPALGPLDLEPYLQYPPFHENYKMTFNDQEFVGIEGVIFGGETGNGARSAHIKDARSARDQCVEAGVDFYLKQWGEYRPATESEETFGIEMVKSGRNYSGRLLDGREWNDLPWKKKPPVKEPKAPAEVQLSLEV